MSVSVLLAALVVEPFAEAEHFVVSDLELVDSEPADPVQIVASEVVLLAEAEPVISVLIAESVLRVAPLYFVALEQRCFVG